MVGFMKGKPTRRDRSMSMLSAAGIDPQQPSSASAHCNAASSPQQFIAREYLMHLHR
jgi:hypothetical protein